MPEVFPMYFISVDYSRNTEALLHQAPSGQGKIYRLNHNNKVNK
jgi:hypothetical protein